MLDEHLFERRFYRRAYLRFHTYYVDDQVHQSSPFFRSISRYPIVPPEIPFGHYTRKQAIEHYLKTVIKYVILKSTTTLRKRVSFILKNLR
jgi:hypothetical protein